MLHMHPVGFEHTTHTRHYIIIWITAHWWVHIESSKHVNSKQAEKTSSHTTRSPQWT